MIRHFQRSTASAALAAALQFLFYGEVASQPAKSSQADDQYSITTVTLSWEQLVQLHRRLEDQRLRDALRLQPEPLPRAFGLLSVFLSLHYDGLGKGGLLFLQLNLAARVAHFKSQADRTTSMQQIPWKKDDVDAISQLVDLLFGDPSRLLSGQKAARFGPNPTLFVAANTRAYTLGYQSIDTNLVTSILASHTEPLEESILAPRSGMNLYALSVGPRSASANGIRSADTLAGFNLSGFPGAVLGQWRGTEHALTNNRLANNLTTSLHFEFTFGTSATIRNLAEPEGWRTINRLTTQEYRMGVRNQLADTKLDAGRRFGF